MHSAGGGPNILLLCTSPIICGPGYWAMIK